MCLEDSLMSYQCGVSSLYFMSAVSNAVGSVSVGRSKIQCSSTLAAFIPLQYTYTQTSVDNKANSKKSTSKIIFNRETSRGTDSTTNAESSLNSRTLLQMSWTSRTPKSESMQIPNLPVSRRRFIPSVFFF